MENQSKREIILQGEQNLGMQAIAKLFKFFFIAFATFLIGVAVWSLTFGGYFSVAPQETVLVLTFGKLKPGNIYESGWGWHFPEPINKVVKVTTKKTQSISTHLFMPRKVSVAGGPERPGLTLAPDKDGYLLTGDKNVMHTQWTVVYKVTDAKKYYLSLLTGNDPREPDTVFETGTRGPQTILRNLLESCVLEISAGMTIDQALYKNISEYKSQVKQFYIKRVNDLDLGIVITEVNLQKISPPAQTLAAFSAVTKAELASSKLLDQAKSYRISLENKTDANVVQILTKAETYKINIVAQVEAQNMYFKQLLKEYNRNPETMLLTLHANTLSQVFSLVKDKYIINTSGAGKQEVRIKLNPDYKQKTK